MNAPFLAAGVLALLGAAIHGGVGERALLRHVHRDALPRTSLGGRATALSMIRASWHMVTIAFTAFGAGLLACAGSGAGESCAGVGRLAAASFAGFGALAVTLALRRAPRMLVRHPAPLMLTAVALLAWWGTAR